MLRRLVKSVIQRNIFKLNKKIFSANMEGELKGASIEPADADNITGKRKTTDNVTKHDSVEPKKAKLQDDIAISTKSLRDNMKGLSKREQRRRIKQLCHEQHSKQKKPAPLHNQLREAYPTMESEFKDTEYYFEDGLRKVKPYFYDFNTFCKGRWVGKTLREIYTKEFRLYPTEYYDSLVKNDRILVNLKPVKSLDVILKDNDMMSSRIHRHEGAVLDTEVEIIVDNAKFLVVNKPASWPVHPCGRFRHNSLTYILQREHGYQNLLGCHRIDRPTSGLMIFAKTKHFANQVITEIRERKVQKQYICKVAGEFPAEAECDQPVTLFNAKLGFNVAWEVEGMKSKDALTLFERISTDGKSSVVLCKPKTGRTHQIRVHLQYLGHPILNDVVYNHPAWGPERFTHGPCTRDLDDVVEEITSQYGAAHHVSTSDELKDACGKCVDDAKDSGAFRIPTYTDKPPLNLPTDSGNSLDPTDDTQAATTDSYGSPTAEVRNESQSNENSKDEAVSVAETQSLNKAATAEVGSSLESAEQSTVTGCKDSETRPSNDNQDAEPKPKFTWPVVANCPECHENRLDPTKESLIIFLHAYRYESERWTFEAKMPDWARQDDDKRDSPENTLQSEAVK